MLTSDQIYHLDEENTIKRRVPFPRILGITKKKGDIYDLSDRYDFIVHLDGECDYLFYSKKREEVIKRIKSCYFFITNKNLPIFEVTGKIDKYMTKKGVNNKLPIDDFRLFEEDVFNK